MIWPFRRKKRAALMEQEDSEEMAELELSKEEEIKISPEKIDLNDRDSRIAYISYLQEQINTAKRECEDVKFEYGQVTSYLKDIQLIDQALPEDKELLVDISEGIHELTLERDRLQGQKYQITDEQKNTMEELADAVVKDSRVLRKEEEFLAKVKKDLGQLHVEKKSLLRDRKEIISKQKMLKMLSKSMAAIMISLMILLGVIWRLYKADITVPFIGMIIFALLISVYIMYEVNKNRKDMIVIEKKCERAVLLINKVKIKYVNSIKLIDYLCSKYNVRNGMELDFIYEQYKKMKRELAKQHESTKLLADYHKILIRELDKIGVKDKEIWFFQSNALFDSREMVEVRHRLNTRRQKLRERIEYNSDLMEKCINELELLQSKKTQYKEDVEVVLGQVKEQ